MPEELKPCPACGNVADVDYDDSFEQMRCPCGVSGPDFCDGEEKAIAVWNALPRRLRWTREKPTKPGWYWYRLQSGGKENVAIGKLHYSCLVFPNNDYLYLDNALGEFAGPIPKPKEE